MSENVNDSSSPASDGTDANGADTDPNRISGVRARQVARDFGVAASGGIPPVVIPGNPIEPGGDKKAVRLGSGTDNGNQNINSGVESSDNLGGNRPRTSRRITIKSSDSDSDRRTANSGTQEETPQEVVSVESPNEYEYKPPVSTTKRQAKAADKTPSLISESLIADLLKAVFSIPAYAGLGDYWALSDKEALDIEKATKKAFKALPKNAEKKVIAITEKWSPVITLLVVLYAVISPRISRYDSDRREAAQGRRGVSENSHRNNSESDRRSTQAAFDAFQAKTEKYNM